MDEAGLLKYWKKKYYPDNVCKMGNDIDPNKVVSTLLHTYSIFILLAIGLVISIIVLLLEILEKKLSCQKSCLGDWIYYNKYTNLVRGILEYLLENSLLNMDNQTYRFVNSQFIISTS